MDRLKHIWATIADLAADLGVPYPTVAAWSLRGIPARRYAQIIAAAHRRGHRLTFEELAAPAPPAPGGAAPDVEDAA